MMQLRDYQLSIASDACQLLEQYSIAYLAMEVRTGKTLTALAAAKMYGARRVLFVTKKKAISSIQDDYDAMQPGFYTLIINFEQLHTAPDTFDLVIIDEAHSCGAFPLPSERTKELRRICSGKPVIFLSGTPTPESWSQIYHQLWISDRSPFAEWPRFYKWAQEFVTVKSRYFYNREVKDYSDADKAKIDQYAAHLFISFSQSDAGFDQVVNDHVLYVDMKPQTMKLVDRLRIDRVFIGRDGQVVEADTEVKLMQKIHQICSGTVITDKGSEAFDDSKARFIRQHFAGKKIAIFYKFIAERAMIQWAFGMKTTDSPEEFRDSDELTYISQIQSGREGVNLATADAIVMFNIDFSAVSYWQARARMQHKDRTTPAEVYWIFARGGIEDKIYKAVLNKKDYTLAHFKRDYDRKRDTDENKSRPGEARLAGKQNHPDLPQRVA